MKLKTTLPRRGARGFTLVELLVALVILGFVITTSLAVFFDRQKRLQRAAEMISASQVLANEAEVWRNVPYSSLVPGEGYEFVTDSDLLAALASPQASAKVEDVESGIRRVTFTLTWGPDPNARRSASLSIYRANLPGGQLFD